MTERVQQIAELLLLIERELRVQGWWQDTSPSEEALSSPEPFCVDLMDFDQWLQWIFLPRMKWIIENGMAMPLVSGIKPMAEQVFTEDMQRAGELIRLLGEFDQLITDNGA
ncbi:YqcC family protein [Pseudomonas sp. TTU2014-080ASC]|uniref:YqcC family protein n=1 Tax=Pseudomonas sp. TTU2014-080ASC TaxID=1729724 RepID=UPI0007189885|nr:YqcC family protein [Pseudomonas sp. TTU2014-080ASC]KRW58644.1 pseudouridine synthase [Pseudomonas sp. TTU2014-080ASC]